MTYFAIVDLETWDCFAAGSGPTPLTSETSLGAAGSGC
jgi:hypothetical protein